MSDKRIVIIGAGLGGLCAAIRLKQEGFHAITLLERNPRVGGVWHENTYPGCACDVPVALYQFSFAQSINWTRFYPQSHEIQAYANDLVDAFELRDCLRLNTEVTDARWDEAARVWRVTTAAGDMLEADAVIGALGQLNRPFWPAIPGRDSFAGVTMHSARWDHAHSYDGKRAGVIGSAASAVQLIPEVAKTAAHLTVFQRTPNWVVPRYDRPITEEEKALLFTQPEVALELAASNRRMIYENADYFFWQAFEWTQAGRDAFTRQAMDQLERQVPDPALRAKLTPDYPVGCKRILITDDFYPALMQDNVDLVTDGITRITPNGVETADGRHHEIDFLVYATGFETTGWHWSTDVVGREGKHLNAQWADHPEAYLGITVADFPNFFVLYGPNTNLGHNSITFMIECQVNYAIKALQTLDRQGAQALQPTRTAQTRYNEELQAALAQTVWADATCTSWYKDDQGRITQNWSSHTRAYADATAEVNLQDYDMIR